MVNTVRKCFFSLLKTVIVFLLSAILVCCTVHYLWIESGRLSKGEEGRKGIMLVSKCHIVRGGARSQVWNWMLCSLIFNPQSKQKCYEIGSTVQLATASEVCQYAESNQNIPAARPTARPKPQRGRETFYSKPSVTLSLLL